MFPNNVANLIEWGWAQCAGEWGNCLTKHFPCNSFCHRIRVIVLDKVLRLLWHGTVFVVLIDSTPPTSLLHGSPGQSRMGMIFVTSLFIKWSGMDGSMMAYGISNWHNNSTILHRWWQLDKIIFPSLQSNWMENDDCRYCELQLQYSQKLQSNFLIKNLKSDIYFLQIKKKLFSDNQN